MSSELHSEHRGNCLVMTFRCGSEGLTPQVLAAGVEVLNMAEGSEAVGAVILRGEGLGFDAGGLPTAPPVDDQSLGQALSQLVEAIRCFPKPAMAVLERPVVGSASTLLWACDLIVASRQASITFSALTLRDIQDVLPRHLAQQLMWLPEALAAEQLHFFGMVNWLTEPGQALPKALQLGQTLQDRQLDDGLDLMLSKVALSRNRSAGV